MANIIFRQIENVLELNQYQLTNQEWVTTWKTWFQSPTLQLLWNQKNKHLFYSPQKVQFVDDTILKCSSTT